MTYLGKSRRNFLKAITTTTVLSATPISTFAFGEQYGWQQDHQRKKNCRYLIRPGMNYPDLYDGPQSPTFPIPAHWKETNCLRKLIHQLSRVKWPNP